MRILLLKPSWARSGGLEQVRYASGVKFPSLGLGILASLSQGHDITVIDAEWDPVPYDKDFDIVGITVTTFVSQRAYEMASKFRFTGAKVVLGGVHASIMPEECLKHANAVVVGEAEYVWKNVLEDAAAGELKKVYRAPHPTDMREVPKIRRDLLKELTWFTSVEATRGCPNKCRYCYLPSVPWNTHRKRPVNVVAEEIDNLPQKAFIFVDENIFGDRDYAVNLFKAIAPYKKLWLVQAPTDIERDDALLDAMGQGGCFNVLVGFQSFNKKSLETAKVHHNRVEKYQTLVKKLHERWIVVSGFFLFGFDLDGPDIFEDTVEIIREIDIDDANMFILTPYPGTPLYHQFKNEGRLLNKVDCTHFAWSNAVFQPKQMSPEELEQGVRWAYDALYPYFRKKLKHVLWNQWWRFLRNPKFGLGVIRGNLRHSRVG